MGRSGRSASPSRSAPARAAPARSAPPAAARAPPPPAARASAPAPAPAPSTGGGGMFSGLGAAMAQGAAMGVGSSLGRMAVGSMFGGSSSHAPEVAHAAPAAPAMTQSDSMGGQNACKMDHMQLTECLNGSNASNCDFYFTALQNCQANNDM